MLDSVPQPGPLLLGIDTCGPEGSVALGRIVRAFSSQVLTELPVPHPSRGLMREGWETTKSPEGCRQPDGECCSSSIEILGQKELAGRTYSAALVSAIEELLEQAGTSLEHLRAIVVVSGPGSFTGVRVGLSAAKGLAMGAGLSVAAVSRLDVLAAKAGVPSSALDAHRHEIFLRLAGPAEILTAQAANMGAPGPWHLETGATAELLAGAHELAIIDPPPARIAVCDQPGAALLQAAWPNIEIVHASAPTAADALALAVPRIERGEFDDVETLDGHYLRRSDAEIFGEKPQEPSKP